MEETICRLCKQPISNYICPNYLANHITKWMPENISHEFTNFHRGFMKDMNRNCDVDEHDMKCRHGHFVCVSGNSKNGTRNVVCLHCYINEVFQWISLKNNRLSDRFMEIFSFGFKKDSFREFIAAENFMPTTNRKTWEDSGICDECGEYSDKLALSNGEWICRGCTER